MKITQAINKIPATSNEGETDVSLSEAETDVTLRQRAESYGSTTLTMTTTAG